MLIHLLGVVATGRLLQLEKYRAREIHGDTETVLSWGNSTRWHEAGGFKDFNTILLHSTEIGENYSCD